MEVQTDIRLGLTGLDDIQQCMGVILTLQKGSVPFSPNMGVGIEEWIDRNTWQYKLIPEVIEQLETYEPRIKVKQVSPKVTDIGKAEIMISYTIQDTNEQHTYTYQY